MKVLSNSCIMCLSGHILNLQAVLTSSKKIQNIGGLEYVKIRAIKHIYSLKAFTYEQRFEKL